MDECWGTTSNALQCQEKLHVCGHCRWLSCSSHYTLSINWASLQSIIAWHVLQRMLFLQIDAVSIQMKQYVGSRTMFHNLARNSCMWHRQVFHRLMLCTLALLDFSIAFEKNCHSILVQGLHAYFAITDSDLHLFSSHQTDCIQLVSLFDLCSVFSSAHSGVPQC